MDRGAHGDRARLRARRPGRGNGASGSAGPRAGDRAARWDQPAARPRTSGSCSWSRPASWRSPSRARSPPPGTRRRAGTWTTCWCARWRAGGGSRSGWRWRLGLVVVASVLAGFAALGRSRRASTPTSVSASSSRPGLNVVPPAVFVLGIGGLAFGLWPRGSIGVVVRAGRLVLPRRDDRRGLRLEPLAARHVADPAHRAGAGRGSQLDRGRVARRARPARRRSLGLAAFGRRDLAGA